MITVDPDTVRFIIDKAREFHAKEAVTIPEEPDAPSDDWAMQVLADHAYDASYTEVVGVINDLEPDQQTCLVALMWLGRGDYDLSEWSDAVEHATYEHNNRTAQYLMATPLLANYLEEGMLEQGYDSP